MALSSSVLSALIRAKLVAKDGIADNSHLTDLCDAIAQAVVEHVQSVAVVNVITACGSGAGTGTGTVS